MWNEKINLSTIIETIIDIALFLKIIDFNLNVNRAKFENIF